MSETKCYCSSNELAKWVMTRNPSQLHIYRLYDDTRRLVVDHYTFVLYENVFFSRGYFHESRLLRQMELVVCGEVQLDQYNDYSSRDFVLLNPRVVFPPTNDNVVDLDTRLTRIENAIQFILEELIRPGKINNQP